MPTYEFLCNDCRKTSELVASIAEYERMKREKELKCTECGSTKVALQISLFEVQTTRKSA